MGDSQDSRQSVNTDAMNEARKAFDDALEEYRSHKDDITGCVDILLEHWEGDGRDAFEKDYILFTRQLEDLQEVLLDLRKGLVEAEEQFIDTDATISKNIAVANS